MTLRSIPTGVARIRDIIRCNSRNLSQLRCRNPQPRHTSTRFRRQDTKNVRTVSRPSRSVSGTHWSMTILCMSLYNNLLDNGVALKSVPFCSIFLFPFHEGSCPVGSITSTWERNGTQRNTWNLQNNEKCSGCFQMWSFVGKDNSQNVAEEPLCSAKMTLPHKYRMTEGNEDDLREYLKYIQWMGSQPMFYTLSQLGTLYCRLIIVIGQRLEKLIVECSISTSWIGMRQPRMGTWLSHGAALVRWEWKDKWWTRTQAGTSFDNVKKAPGNNVWTFIESTD